GLAAHAGRESAAAPGERRARFKTPARFAEISCAVSAAADTRGRGRKGALQPLGKILSIVATHHVVANAVAQLTDTRLQRGAALGSSKTAAFDLPRPDHV